MQRYDFIVLNDRYHSKKYHTIKKVIQIKELDMERPFVNVIISLLNVSDGQDQHTIQATEDYEDLIEKVARIIMLSHTEILYGDGFNAKF